MAQPLKIGLAVDSIADGLYLPWPIAPRWRVLRFKNLVALRNLKATATVSICWKDAITPGPAVTSRSQAAQSPQADTGQRTPRLAGPRRSSMSMVCVFQRSWTPISG